MSIPSQRICAVSQELLDTEPALRSSLDFGPNVLQGQGDGPTVLIGDQSEIPLYNHVAKTRLDYRMACLAKPSDVVVVRARDRGFEQYLARVLNLHDVTFVAADTDAPVPVTKQALAGGELGKALTALANGARHLTVQPYLTKGTAWRLAQHLGNCTAAPVFVSGPSPRVSQRANDKLWFADLVHHVIGRHATPPSKSAFGPAATAGLVRHLARRASQVVVKVPDSAGSFGNIVLRSDDLHRLSLTAIRDFLMQRLDSVGWPETFPLLVGIWDENVISSPSVQMWIPLPEKGLPRVEGVFEQRVRTEKSAFVGAARSHLPKHMQANLATEAVCIAEVLQRIGYFGRCSLDAVIYQPQDTQPRIHWVECNGRWGGVSIPMTLAQRLNGGTLPKGLLIIQETLAHLPAMTTSDLLARLDGILYEPSARREGIVVLSPPQAATGVMVNLLVMAGSQAAAERLAQRAIGRIERHNPKAVG